MAHHSFSFIIPTISRDSWWHYATRCNTITSPSQFSAAAAAASSSSAIQQIQMSPRAGETLCDFLPLPDSRVTSRAGRPSLIISCPLVLRVQDDAAQCWRRMREIDSRAPSHRNSLGCLTKSWWARSCCSSSFGPPFSPTFSKLEKEIPELSCKQRLNLLCSYLIWSEDRLRII